MPFITLPDGTATEVDWDLDSAFIARAKAAGGTLAGAVIHSGVQATAFDKPVKVTPLYDGLKALEQGNIKGLTPVAEMSDYRICARDGALVHPPAVPGTE